MATIIFISIVLWQRRLTGGQRKQIGPVQDEGDMFPPELPEDARKDRLESALTIRHPRQRGILGLVLEDPLKRRDFSPSRNNAIKPFS
jgi:hypothetical protein